MFAPLSWLKEYVEITLSPEKLGERLTEIGLGCEKITKTDKDVIFELEITPNRPDLLSIIGVAREIAALENKKIKPPRLRQDCLLRRSGYEGRVGGQSKKNLPLIIKTDPKINPRFTGIIINGIKVGESPPWLKEKLEKINQRPISNIVDITNFVMFELGNPIHAFDYDKIKGHQMRVHQTKGGEVFKSVDGISYSLPKDAVVLSDKEKIIDLCGIKGGKNSGTFPETKTIFIRVPVEVPSLIRRASQNLSLRSEASSIFERGVNAGGTVEALARCVGLILEIAGGEVASSLYDLKEKDFKPWKLKLRLERLNKILGIALPPKSILKILENLNLSPHLVTKEIIETTIPTYRNDLKIEEDLIEEVARLYGYNRFPKTLPAGQIPTKPIPYFKDFTPGQKAKEILQASGFSEIYSYSLISEEDLKSVGIKPETVLRVDNPVSREYEYLRPTLKINLIKALKQNLANFSEVNFFELGKVYLGKNLGEKEEKYFLSGISNIQNPTQAADTLFRVKGVIEAIQKSLGINEQPILGNLEMTNEYVLFELDFSRILEKASLKKTYIPIPKYPPVIEDLTLIVAPEIKTGDIIAAIKKQSPLISEVSLLPGFENSRTFHLIYQHRERNLTNEEVGTIREKILKALEEKFNASLKN